MADKEFPPALKEAAEKFIYSIIDSGQDMDEAIADLRTQLMERMPDKEAEVDLLLEVIKRQAGKMKWELGGDRGPTG